MNCKGQRMKSYRKHDVVASSWLLYPFVLSGQPDTPPQLSPTVTLIVPVFLVPHWVFLIQFVPELKKIFSIFWSTKGNYIINKNKKNYILVAENA